MAKKKFSNRTGFNSTGARLTGMYVLLSALCLAIVTQPFLGDHSASDIESHFTFALSALAATTAAMALVTRMVTEPIHKLIKAARRIADGDLDARIEVDCSCDIGELGESMNTMVARLRDNTAEIRDLASTDPSTGLPNRSRFQTLLAKQMNSIDERGNRGTGSVFFIDVIELRKVNDRFGHETSDQLLKAIAQRFAEALSADRQDQACEEPEKRAAASKHVLARFGGSELVVLVPGLIDQSGIEAMAKRLHAALAGTVDIGGRQFHPKIAIGVAKYPEDSASPAKIKQYAALACNNAMASMKLEKTVLFEHHMLQAIKKRETMERDLRTAIAERQFEVYYQPKVNSNNWGLAGVEALVRLNHPERGVVGPGEFIPIAEMTGLIFDIGLIVLDEAIAQCAAWTREGQTIETSINVSIEQLENSDFSNLVIATLDKYRCPADLITIEITETIANTNIAIVARHLTALRAAGVRIAIDDFGTGYSNLAQLNGLKFDILKVDRSFVSGIETEGRSREVSRAIIQLGKNLGCRVVFEGTETPGQVAAAAQLGCDEIQGFYFSRPLRRRDFEAWRAERRKNPVRQVMKAIAAGT